MIDRICATGLLLVLPTTVLAQFRGAPRTEQLAPTIADFACGKDSERQRFDCWRAESGTTISIVLMIHGGGWKGGDKSTYDAHAIEPFMKAGISVATISFATTFGDAGRANIDSNRIAQSIRPAILAAL